MDITLEIGTLLSGSVGKFIEEMLKVSSISVKNVLLNMRTNKCLNHTIESVKDLSTIKTIIMPEKPVHISSVYIAPKLRTYDSVISEPEFFNQANKPGRVSLMIEGTGGHGKTLFMRNLCLNFLKHGKYLPVFVLLRKFKFDDNLISLAAREFNFYGFENNTRVIINAIKNGKIILLLDGFDELNRETKTTVLNDLERLRRKYDRFKFVISSRPEICLKSIYFLEVYKLKDLTIEDQLFFIEKQCSSDANTKTTLQKAINNNSFIYEVLITPMLLSLLIIAYKNECTVPESLVEFYKSIFQVMIYRHDAIKAFSRQKSSPYGRYDLQRIFELFCFLTAKHRLYHFNGTVFYNQLRLALSNLFKENIDSIPSEKIEGVMSEIVHTSCLIIEDGLDEYAFMHRTIQEFYAASFISNLSDELLKTFFQQMATDYDKYESMGNITLFLKGLKPDQYSKFYAKIVYESLFNQNGLVSEEQVNRLIHKSSHLYYQDTKSIDRICIYIPHIDEIDSELSSSISKIIRNLIDSNSQSVGFVVRNLSTDEQDLYCSDIVSDMYCLPIHLILDKCRLWSKLNSNINDKLSKIILSKTNRLDQDIKSKDNILDLITL